MNARWSVLLRVATTQPHLLAAHAANYAALVRDEGALSMALLQRRLLLGVLAGVSLCMAAGLAGVAAMLWATLPTVVPDRSWVLLVVPALPLLIGWWSWREASQGGPLPLWAAWREQLAADAALLQRGAP